MQPAEITKRANLSPPIKQHHTLMEIWSRKNFAYLVKSPMLQDIAFQKSIYLLNLIAGR